jgi:Na+/H+-dicarboxylate symporter
MKKWPLHVKILIGMLLGILWGIIAVKMKWSGFTIDYVKPFGIIFMNLLKLIAIPMIITSLIMGVSSLNDVKRLGRIGGRTLGMFLATTVIAVTIGVIMVNLIKPGNALPAETKEMLLRSNSETVQKGFEDAESVTNKGPLQPLVDLFPDNLIDAASKNTNMLQMVIISLVLGIGLMLIDKEKAKPVIAFMDGANDLVMKVVDLIMLIAPIGVFSLLAAMIVDLTKDDLSQTLGLFMALGAYINTLLLALVLHIVLVYLPIVKWVAKLNPIWFLKKMRPVQLLAFSTSSSNATLPVNMENCEKELGVSEEITGFVLPIGATLNMDGTSCYQAVATVFIAQVFQMDLSIMQQLTIILTATLSSIGTAGVPGVGIVMLVIVLNSVGVPIEGIALIMGVDRILDMCRTVVNVTGDAVVCCAIAKLEGKLL